MVWWSVQITLAQLSDSGSLHSFAVLILILDIILIWAVFVESRKIIIHVWYIVLLSFQVINVFLYYFHSLINWFKSVFGGGFGWFDLFLFWLGWFWSFLSLSEKGCLTALCDFPGICKHVWHEVLWKEIWSYLKLIVFSLMVIILEPSTFSFKPWLILQI